MKLSREEFIKIFCHKRNYIRYGSIVLDSDEEYELFIKKYGEPDKDAAYCDKKQIRENVSEFRIEKIERMNIQEKDFIKMYKEDPRSALEFFYQFPVPDYDKSFYMITTVLNNYNGALEFLYEIFMGDKSKHRYKAENSTIDKFESSLLYGMLEKKNGGNGKSERNNKSIKKDKNITTFSSRNKETIKYSGVKFFRDLALASTLKNLYQCQCQVCKIQINTPNGLRIQAHHIQPYNDVHKGDDCWGNMLVICPNCHLQFDELYFAIEPNTLTIHCFDETNVFHGKKIKLQPGHQLEYTYLKYTWNRFLEMKSVVIEN
ncbi:HNH endonuclease [Priestia megaterium]